MKKRILFLVGGRSGEHEISLISGKHVLAALDRNLFEPIVCVIQKSGVLSLVDESAFLALSNDPTQVQTPEGIALAIEPYRRAGRGAALIADGRRIEFDVAFPILHGPGGEDGTVQGLFEFSGVPVVGCSVKASAVAMDKAMTKSLCAKNGVSVVPFFEVFRGQNLPPCPFDLPVFVKPAHLGSSLGVTKVKQAAQYAEAVKAALLLDEKVLIEPGIEGREIEIAILGTRSQKVVSIAGEIRPKKEFYDYEAKYVMKDGADLFIPAKISESELAEVQRQAVLAFDAVECRGMARIDFFLTSKGEFLLNEINTIPGFTPISMYPKLLGAVGVSYASILTRLIEIAEAK